MNNNPKKYDGEVLRLALLSAHYRQPLDWSETKCDECEKILEKLYKALMAVNDITAASKAEAPTVFEALLDDLNTPKAISELISIGKNLARKSGDLPILKAQLLEAGRLLGVLQKDPEVWLGYWPNKTSSEKDFEFYENVIHKIIQEYQNARNVKDFETADKLREQLHNTGFFMEETPNIRLRIR